MSQVATVVCPSSATDQRKVDLRSTCCKLVKASRFVPKKMLGDSPSIAGR